MQTLFDPDSIAVIGASANPEKVSGRPIRFLQHHDYPGTIYPVNPNHTEIAGLPCYPDITAVPHPPDLALVIIPAPLVLNAVTDTLEAGTTNIVIVSSGFAETATTTGVETQRALTTLATEHNATIVGPNSQGVIDFRTRLTASFTPALDRDTLPTGPVSFVTQSGAFGGALTTLLLETGVGLNKWIATGNEAAVESLDILHHLATDNTTSVAAGYIEGFEDGRKLIELKRTPAGIDLPVVLLKVGRSDRGRAAAASHTGKVATHHRVYDAIFRETGVMAVSDIDRFVAVTRTLTQLDTLPGPRLGILTTSGGAGVHLADEAIDADLAIPELTGHTRDVIEAAIPDYGAAFNPVDVTGQVVNSRDAFADCLSAMLADDDLDAIALQITNVTGDNAVEFADLVTTAADPHDTPLFVCWTGGVDKTKGLARYDDAGIPVFENPARCIRTIAHLAAYNAAKPRLHAANHLPARPPIPDPATGLQNPPAVLPEPDAKALLREYGIPVPAEHHIDHPTDNISAAVEDLGTPVVAKLVSPGLPHRTNVGGVRTDLTTPEDVRRAVDHLFDLAVSLDVDVHGVSLQEQLPSGTEISVGITTDPDFGPLVMFGRGGVAIEAIDDVTFRTIPLAEEQAASMLTELRTINPTTFTPKQRTALTGILTRLSDLYADNQWIHEADLNPVLLTPDSAVALDALFQRDNPEPERDPPPPG